MSTAVIYRREQEIEADEFIDMLVRSSLAKRRPVEEIETIRGMLKHANVIITARTQAGELIGISRAVSDFHYCTYLSELAVDAGHQGTGIGRALVDMTHREGGLQTHLILISAPGIESFYGRLNMDERTAFMVRRTPR